MKQFPTITDVMAHLRESGRHDMALAVEWQQASLSNCRAANERNYKAAAELREKYEPAARPFRYRTNRAPMESDG